MEGSTPRHDGTKMAVGADGKTYGTIGGSLIEAAAVKEAINTLVTGKSSVLSFKLTGKDASAPGMICGGKAEILLDYLAPSEANKGFSRQWYDTVNNSKDFYFITHVQKTGGAFQVLGHALFVPSDETFTSTSFTVDDLAKIKPELHNVSTNSILPLGDTSVMVDRIRKLKTIYCFGAGHVAVPTAHIAALAGFRVFVLDDRPDYASIDRFPEVYRTIVVQDFNNAFRGLEIDKDSFIVIVTRGHQFDRTVLEKSLKTDAGYIGMISSKRKRTAIYEALLAGGVKQERLEFVHSPIGIDIGGETPEEIAVSIVAELIQIRSRQA
jgi:xanthine dehydrogenase accessory factor